MLSRYDRPLLDIIIGTSKTSPFVGKQLAQTLMSINGLDERINEIVKKPLPTLFDILLLKACFVKDSRNQSGKLNLARFF